MINNISNFNLIKDIENGSFDTILECPFCKSKLLTEINKTNYEIDLQMVVCSKCNKQFNVGDINKTTINYNDNVDSTAECISYYQNKI